MRKFIHAIIMSVGVVFAMSAPAHAYRPVSGYSPDQCWNVRGHQDMRDIVMGRYRHIGHSRLNLCARGHRYTYTCFEVVMRGDVLYCRTGYGLKNPCTVNGGSYWQQDIAARACEQNHM